MPAMIALFAVRAIPDMRLDQATVGLASIGVLVGVLTGAVRGAVTRVWSQRRPDTGLWRSLPGSTVADRHPPSANP
jgi:hypothetical protein